MTQVPLAAADLPSGMLMHGLIFKLFKHYVSRAESSRVVSGSDQRTEPRQHPTGTSDRRFDCGRTPSLAPAGRFFLDLCVAAEFASEDILCPLRTAMCRFD